MKTPKLDVGYLRYSNARQDGNTTVDVQRAAIQRAAGGPVREYVDLAKTGRAVAGRSGLLTLLDDAADGKIGRVFLYSWSRLGRSSETHAVVSSLEDAGCEVISATEGADKLSAGISLVVAQDFSRRLSQNVSRALEQRFSERTWTGGRPAYGLKAISNGTDKRKRLAINEPEAAIIRKIFDLYLRETIGVKAIAERLRKQGAPTRGGAGWSFTSVRGALRNSIYTGVVKFKQRQYRLNKATGRRLYKWAPDADQLTYTDPSLRIIDDETFKKTQEKLNHRAKATPLHGAARAIRPLTGLMYCGVCNSVFYAQKTGMNENYSYGCGCKSRGGACSNRQRIREGQYIEATRILYSKIFETSDVTIREIVKAVESSGFANRQQGESLRKEIADQDRIITGLQRLLVDPDVLTIPETKRSIIRQCGEAEAKREKLRDSITELGESANRNAGEFLREAKAVFEEARACLSAAASGPELHRFMEDFVGPVTVLADGALVRGKPGEVDATGIMAASRCYTGREALRTLFWSMRAA